MKKTIQSIMTAAVFAAALGTGAGDTISAQFAASSDAGDSVTTVPQTTYGPPVWMWTTDETEEDTNLREEGVATVYTEEDSTTATESALQLSGQVTVPMLTTTLATTLSLMGTTTIPQQSETTTCTTTVTCEGTTALPQETEPEEPIRLSGEAPLYNEPGDLDHNGSWNARDVSLLKQYLLSNKSSGISETGDVNLDGKIDNEDVKALIGMLTGKPEEEDPPVQTTTATTKATLPVTTTDVTQPTYMVLYGPPAAWD